MLQLDSYFSKLSSSRLKNFTLAFISHRKQSAKAEAQYCRNHHCFAELEPDLVVIKSIFHYFITPWLSNHYSRELQSRVRRNFIRNPTFIPLEAKALISCKIPITSFMSVFQNKTESQTFFAVVNLNEQTFRYVYFSSTANKCQIFIYLIE